MSDQSMEFRFYSDAADIAENMLSARLDDVDSAISDRAKREAEGDTYLVDDFRTPLRTFGSDLVTIGFIAYQKGDSPSFEARVNLFNDSSPYVPEDDFDRGISSNGYALIGSSTLLPSASPTQAESRSFLERDDRPADYTFGGESFSSEFLRPLSVAECESFLAVLPGAEAHINMTEYISEFLL